MRYVFQLLIVSLFLLAPSVTWGQSSSSSESERPYQRFLCKQKTGRQLDVLLYSKQEIRGRLSSVQSDHFELTHKGSVHKIRYEDVAHIELSKGFWPRTRRVIGRCVMGIATPLAYAGGSLIWLAEKISSENGNAFLRRMRCVAAFPFGVLSVPLYFPAICLAELAAKIEGVDLWN